MHSPFLETPIRVQNMGLLFVCQQTASYFEDISHGCAPLFRTIVFNLSAEAPLRCRARPVLRVVRSRLTGFFNVNKVTLNRPYTPFEFRN